MMDKSIEEYNAYLVKSHNYFNASDYFSKIHRTFFPEVDVSFMDYFLELSNPEKINNLCIYEKDLRKFNLINDQIRSKDIIQKHNLIKDIDWNYIEHQSKETPRIFFNLGVYLHTDLNKCVVFTPKAFKKIILGSSNNYFLEYYILLETIVRYYQDYQIKYMDKEKIRIEKEEKRKKDEMIRLEKQIEEYEKYIQRITTNVNTTIESCKKEIQSILSICDRK